MSADALAILAAFMFALAAVLQQREAVKAGGGGMSAAFFLALIRKPIWLLGTAALIGGYILQGAALGKGRLVIIQPLLVTTVVFALPLGVLLTHQVVTRRDWAAAAGVVAALAAFIVIGDPAPGLDDAPGWEWAVSLVIVSVLAALVVLFGRHLRAPRRAAALGSAAGMLFGLSACLAKPVVEELGDDGLATVLGDWLTWAMIGTGAAAFLIQQGRSRRASWRRPSPRRRWPTRSWPRSSASSSSRRGSPGGSRGRRWPSPRSWPPAFARSCSPSTSSPARPPRPPPPRDRSGPAG